MKLKISQKNQLFDYISHSQLGPAMFQYKDFDDWQTATSKVVISLKSQEYFFEISDASNERLSLEFSPGEERLFESVRVDDWAHTVYYFQKWVDTLEEEILIEDKWKLFEKLVEENSLVTNTNIINDKFTLPEYIQLQDKFEYLKSEILQLNFTAQQINLLNDKLDMVLDQTQYLGKFDWRSLFIGTIMSIIIQLSLSQEQGKELWTIIKKIFTNYFLSLQ